jgi:hypothetical protein
MKCEKCDGKWRIHMYPEDIYSGCCEHCVMGEVPAYREFWLCRVRGEDFAILLRGKWHWYYYDARIGGWFIVEAEVDPKCRMVKK